MVVPESIKIISPSFIYAAAISAAAFFSAWFFMFLSSKGTSFFWFIVTPPYIFFIFPFSKSSLISLRIVFLETLNTSHNLSSETDSFFSMYSSTFLILCVLITPSFQKLKKKKKNGIFSEFAIKKWLSSETKRNIVFLISLLSL